MSVATSPLRLHVTAHRAIDSEPPVEPGDTTPDAMHRVIGSLALASPVRDFDDVPEAAPVRRLLELVPTHHEPHPVRGEDYFDAVHTSRDALPAPGPRAGALVGAIMEALTGRRPLVQLVRWLTTEVYDELEVCISPDRGRGWAGNMRRLIVSEPADGVAEVTAVIDRGARASAIAFRMEGRDGRWVVTALQMA